MLTLTGSGGCGKTRLALQAASGMLEVFPDGVWLVEFAPLAAPGLVPQTAAAVLGLKEEPGRPVQSTLVGHLRVKKILFILDNCEHLIKACAELAELYCMPALMCISSPPAARCWVLQAKYLPRAITLISRSRPGNTS